MLGSQFSKSTAAYNKSGSFIEIFVTKNSKRLDLLYLPTPFVQDNASKKFIVKFVAFPLLEP